MWSYVVQEIKEFYKPETSINFCVLNSGCVRKMIIVKCKKRNFCAYKLTSTQDEPTILSQLFIHICMFVSEK